MAIFRIIIIVISLFFGHSAFALDIPQDLIEEVNNAMKNGKILYDMYLKGPATEGLLLHEINEAKDKIKDFCNFKYNAYIVNTDNGNIIYLIGESERIEEIVFGRHYKITKEEITPSTVSCFVSSLPPDNAVAAFSSHLLTNTPTEFHVFLSLKHKIPLYITTSIGTWKVESGKIDLMETKNR